MIIANTPPSIYINSKTIKKHVNEVNITNENVTSFMLEKRC